MVKKKMAKVTIEGLARMVAKGFEEAGTKVDGLKSEMNKRFDKFENIVLADHRRRTEKLELEVKEFKSLIGIK